MPPMWRFPLLLLMLIPAVPVLAAETEWREVAPGAQLRIIGSLSPTGDAWIALELKMPPALNTYWHVPGESGIPTELSLRGPSGPVAAKIRWPYPSREIKGDVLDHVYRGDVTLPVELPKGWPEGPVSAEVIMGICADICIPVLAEFVLPPGFVAPSRSNALRIRQALADVPQLWEADDGADMTVWFDASAAQLVLENLDPRIDPASILVTMDGTSVLFGAPEATGTAGTLRFPDLSRTEISALPGDRIRVTFLTAGLPHEMVRELRR